MQTTLWSGNISIADVIMDFFSLNHHYKDLTLQIFEKTFCYLANFVPLVVDILITVQNFPLLTVTAVALPSNTEDTKVLS